MDLIKNHENKFKKYGDIFLAVLVMVISIPKIYMPLINDFSTGNILISLLPPLIIFYLFKSKNSLGNKTGIVMSAIIVGIILAMAILFYFVFIDSFNQSI